MDKRGFKSARIKRGVKTWLRAQFGYDDARRFCFATVTSEFVWIRFRLSVGRLRGLCWASIGCGTLSS